MAGEVWGWLVVMEHKRRFSGDDMLTMRRAATLLALQMSTERRAMEADWDAGASLTAELLTGCTDPATVQRRADRLGVRLDAPRVVVLIGSRTGRAAAGDFRAVLAAFREVAPEATVQAAAADGGRRGDRRHRRRARRRRRSFARRREGGEPRRPAAPAGADVVVGLSTVCSGPGRYAEAYAEAPQVVECIRRFAPGPGPDVFSADDLGAGRVLLATSDRDAVSRFAEATFGMPRPRRVEGRPARDAVLVLRQHGEHPPLRRCASACTRTRSATGSRASRS